MYTVECFYGSAITVDTSPASADSCMKTMLVKSDDTTQGCSRIYAYRGTTLSNNMTSTSTFDASFRCSSRAASSGVINPYTLNVA